MGLLISIIIGAIAGWLAGVITKSKSAGLLFNILLGIAGGFIGNWLFEFLNISTISGWLGSIISSTIGAVLLIILVKKVFKRK